MNDDDLERLEVSQLIAEFLEGRLDDDGLVRLSELLHADPQAALSFVDSAIIHDMLGARYANERSETAAVVLLTSLGVPVDAELQQLSSRASAGAEHRLARWAWRTAVDFRRIAAGLAAALAICLGLLWTFWTRPPQIATVTRITDAGFESNPLAVGTRLSQGDRIRTWQGLVEITFDSGAVMAVKAPADVELLTTLSARSRDGRVTVDVGERAHGFRIETPTASVVDLGTEFGVGVDGDATDVVVFDGSVDLFAKQANAANKRSQRLLEQGDALRVGRDGGLRRIVSMTSREFPTPNMSGALSEGHVPVIESVTDNIRGNQTTKCYRIVHSGLVEDATAYVDRSHQWNGLDKAGLPKFLEGADFIMAFNDDKRSRDLEVTVTFAQAANVYVLYDKRRTPPDWLQLAFEDTGIEIGLDEGPSRVQKSFTNGIGPGVSVDYPFGVWKSVAAKGQMMVFGPQYGHVSQGEAHAMYGIAATAQ